MKRLGEPKYGYDLPWIEASEWVRALPSIDNTVDNLIVRLLYIRAMKKYRILNDR